MARLPIRRRDAEVSRPAWSGPRPFGGWDPFAEFEDLWQQMGRVMETAFGELGRADAWAHTWGPAADLSETDDAFVARIDLPGVKKEDVAIELGDQELRVTGRIKQEDDDNGGRWRHWHRRTRRMGEFETRLSLPAGVQSDKVSANLADGVLTVTLPKAEGSRPRRIEITGG